MIILGVDPGLALVGCGIIEKIKNSFELKHFITIKTKSNTPLQERFLHIYKEFCKIIETYRPDACAIESIFFAKNVKTAISVSQARGVIILATALNNIPIFEYTPLQVKQAVVGYGNAEKHQIQYMVKSILRLKELPTPVDSADALAIALCHANTTKFATKS